ncbi:type IV secretory system conjugative DNA transfer family protein [Paracraurococcus lichenis]|uniref:Type IV secretory system conjugative DNA transfer family protein n=1 Tax=Paracraurococcus lichenis TaxID=3064888 RepID=A0ABT9EAH7_9PROT|nr:type IV secretory system conjugative DNA transfer family protein [Paracraurococcus sp. LOR1-02]MDO9713200.1 type IV secretory system conjugative DNA transfer family protein [Paracraurococcus sp. LOR1-02]
MGSAATLRWASLGARGLLWCAILAAGWLLVASLLFLVLDDLLFDGSVPALARPVFWWHASMAAAAGRLTLEETAYLGLSGLLPALAMAGVAQLWIRQQGGLRGAMQAAFGIYLVTRSASHTYGAADWMPMAEVRKLFPSEPEPTIGGVVLGEAVRMDQTGVARVRFDPDVRTGQHTWGPGGKAPLMFDYCREGNTHGVVMVAAGLFKSTSFSLTLDYWKTGAFIFDPAGELAGMTADWRLRLGHTVHVLDPMGQYGTNVVMWITRAIAAGHPLAEVFLTATVERCYGRTPPSPGQGNDNAAYFREQGRNLFTALLAHVLWHPGLTPDEKTLRLAKRLLTLPEQELRDVLLAIYETSHSRLARDLAAPLFDLTKVTFDGIRSNANQGTAWLNVESFANMVSTHSFDLADLCTGRATVYCQISMDALEAMPEIGRAIGSAALNSVIQAEGRVTGRVWFFIDEAVLWGPMGALRTARDQGRKYKITLCLCYQSEGQVEEVWGAAGKRAWFGNVSWLMYGAQRDLSTSEHLSKQLGTFGAKEFSESHNSGTSGRALEWGTRSRGTSHSSRDTARALMMPHELMQDMRTDERILLYLAAPPIRCRASIAFCRPEVRDRIGVTAYQPGAGRP